MTDQDAPSPRTDAAERILTAAQRLFADHGYDGVSMRDIAEAADVSKANVFHHFKSKAELYRLILDEYTNEFRQLLTLLRTNDGSIEQILTDFTDAYIQQLSARPEVARLILRQLLTGKTSDPNRDHFEALVAERFDEACEAFADFQRAGRLAPDVDPRALTQTLLSGHLMLFVLRNVAERSRHGKALAGTQQYSRNVLDIILHGVLSPRRNPESTQARGN